MMEGDRLIRRKVVEVLTTIRQCRREIRSVHDLIATLEVLGDGLQSDRLIRRFHLAEEGYVGSEQLSPENQADKTIEAATSVENLVKEYWGW